MLMMTREAKLRVMTCGAKQTVIHRPDVILCRMLIQSLLRIRRYPFPSVDSYFSPFACPCL